MPTRKKASRDGGPSPPDRAQFIEMTLYGAAHNGDVTLTRAILMAKATMWPALESSRGKGDMQALFGPVDAILGKQKWILGDDKGGRGRQQTTRK